MTEKQREEMKNKIMDNVKDMVKKDFNGDYCAYFDHYNISAGESTEAKEIKKILNDIKVGNMVTKPIIAKGIADAIEDNLDGKIGKSEFLELFMPPPECEEGGTCTKVGSDKQ